MPSLSAVSAQNLGPVEQVNSSVVFLVLQIHSFGNVARLKNERLSARSLAGEEAEVTIEGGSMIRLAKSLLDSEEFGAIRKLDRETRAMLGGRDRTVGDKRHHVPGRGLPSLIRDGITAVPLSEVKAVDADLRKYRAKRDALVEKFLAAYPERKAEAKLRLGDNFDPEDYPSVGELRRRFHVAYRFVQLGAPEALRSISDDVYREACERAAAEAERFLEHANRLVWQELRGLLAQVGDLLKPKEDGTRRAFRDSVLPQFRECLALLRSRNVAGDKAVTAAIDAAERATSGFDARALRDHRSLAARVAGDVERLRGQVEAAIRDLPSRQIDLED